MKNEIVGYKYNPENWSKDYIGIYHDGYTLDVSSMHPSMWMRKKDIRKVKWKMFWWDIRHFYHLFRIKGKLKDWQNRIMKEG